jgi:multiple sugar transport system ATP-binding protein
VAEIRIENLHKAFGSFVAVQDSNFVIDDGSFFVMLGPSGCGKTTTLRMIAGLELPTAGRILLGGEDVTFKRAAQRDIAFVFQMFALYPHMSVADNIGFPLKCEGVSRAEVRQRVQETAKLLRIEPLLRHRVAKLSGGDRQRVSLGRAIIRRPKAFLMDEPLGALDSEFRHLMCEELRDLHDNIGATTVYVTHDQLEAMSMADKIAVMNHGVVEHIDGPQQIYDRPATMFVADFIGSPPMNLLELEGSLRRGDSSISYFETRLNVPEIHEDRETGALALGVRPEHISISDAGSLRGRVFAVEYLGTNQIVTIDIDRAKVKARLPSTIVAKIGETVGVSFQPQKLVVFDATTGRAIQSALFEGAHHG